MTTGGTSSGRRRGPVAGRGRSIRPPAAPPPSPPEPPTPPPNPPEERARPASRSGRFLRWSGWPKLGAALTTVATVVVAGGTAGALYFTNQSLRATNNQYGLAQQTAVTDRFRLAAEQLASDKINVRLSGIYLLERLAKDSPDDHTTVFAVIAAFVRTQAPATDCPSPSVTRPVDVEAALTVIGRRETAHERPHDVLDLHDTCLTRANLTGTNLSGTNLTGVNLNRANLTGANLTGANLFTANLSLAELHDANLTGADLTGADLSLARMSGANLNRARLLSANLTGAKLTFANLTGVTLFDTNLRGARLGGANLTGVQVDAAVYDDTTSWPDGFVLPPPRR